MCYSNDYDHIRNMFWNGETKGCKYNLDETGIEHALSRALKDYSARSNQKDAGEGVASVSEMLNALKNPTDTSQKSFLRELIDYFKDAPKDQDSYDAWHKARCEQFQNAIQGANIRKNVTYGKAQKIVNMTMKTIFCLEDAKEKDNKGYFAHCHMPIDSYILEWFWQTVKPKIKEKVKNNNRGNFCKYNMTSWSNLTFEDIVDTQSPTICGYQYYVVQIRKHLKSLGQYSGLTPFKAEFYIWPEIQWEKAANDFLKQELFEKISKNIGITTNNTTINKICCNLQKALEDLQKTYH